jgi:hydroxyacylglutathione hydrolase
MGQNYLSIVVKMMLLLIFCVLIYAVYSTWKMLRQSKLSDFNNSSLLFRILYALYNSSAGQNIHNAMVFLFKNYKYKGSHTKLCTACDNFGGYSVSYLPFLSDNYAYFIVDRYTGETAVVDPADPELVLKEFQTLHEVHGTDRPLQLVMVLCTHKHMDHAGGNSVLQKAIPGLRVISGHHEPVASQNVYAQHGDVIMLGSSTSIQILDTPCHTTGHVVFFVTDLTSSAHVPSKSELESDSHPSLFSGDTLFSGGVGKFFEGTGSVMEKTLFRIIRPMPLNTHVYCGHEYTVSNLEFGLLVEPNNEALAKRLEWARERRDDRLPTIPSMLREEFKYNVYLRADCEDVISAVYQTTCQDTGESDAKYHRDDGHNTKGRVGLREQLKATYGVVQGRESGGVADVLERLRRWKDTQVRPQYIE